MIAVVSHRLQSQKSSSSTPREGRPRPQGFGVAGRLPRCSSLEPMPARGSSHPEVMDEVPVTPPTSSRPLKHGASNGIIYTMKTTIDKAGRLVVPKAIREAAHLKPGTEVEFRVVAGRVEIEPVPLDIELERRGRLVVAIPRQSQPALTELEVEETIIALRNATADDEAS